jgi:hypothetical protein
MLAAVMAAMQAMQGGTVAMAVAAEPQPLTTPKPSVTIGNLTADGWLGKDGRLCVTVLRGRARHGMTFTNQAGVDELQSPVISKLVAQCEKAAGRKIGT